MGKDFFIYHSNQTSSRSQR